MRPKNYDEKSSDGRALNTSQFECYLNSAAGDSCAVRMKFYASSFKKILFGSLKNRLFVFLELVKYA